MNLQSFMAVRIVQHLKYGKLRERKKSMAGKRKEATEIRPHLHDVDPRPSVEILHLLTKNQYPITQINQEFAIAIIQAGIDESMLPEMTIRESPVEIDGDFGFHCAPLAKKMRQSPNQIAQELVTKLQVDPNGIIIEYVAVGPYVNAKVDFSKFGALVRNSVFEMGADYGKENIGTGQRIVIDMSSPNIAKRMSVGHLRSTIIGDSLARIFKHLNYDVIKDNHLGDWGTQFGHLLRAIELWGDEETIAANPIEELQKLYVRISDAGEPDSDLYKELSREEAGTQAKKVKNEGREWFQKLENGDEEA
nr:arginine--tRNA ligase [Candidatus Woesebacteria bacterium]